jgi:hypothetical protein
MTPNELLTEIEGSGGRLEVLPDGYLRAHRVPRQLHDALKEHKSGLIALLIERKKPRTGGFLIPEADLLAAAERIRQKQNSTFEYRPRSEAQWNRRAHQWGGSTFGVAVAPPNLDPVAEPDGEEAEGENEDEYGKSPNAKVTTATPCVDCGHQRSDHHTTPEPHWCDGDHAYYCVTSHCDVRSFKNGASEPCSCLYFRATATAKAKLTRPRVGDYDLCANPACAHFKISHCTKAKPGKSRRLKPGESAYRILQKPDGTSYGCKHFSPDDPDCQCDSTSCSHTTDGKEFCGCEKFISPFAGLRSKATKLPTPRKSRKREANFMTGEGLFSATAETAENVKPLSV